MPDNCISWGCCMVGLFKRLFFLACATVIIATVLWLSVSLFIALFLIGAFIAAIMAMRNMFVPKRNRYSHSDTPTHIRIEESNIIEAEYQVMDKKHE
jgi:hypothetical protein